MEKPDELSFDFLTGREGDFMEVVMKELADVAWAKPLIGDINDNGGLKGENKARLFELRFGYELHRVGVHPRYEVPGEGGSTLDFGFEKGGGQFLVEMMRLEETAAALAATTKEELENGTVMVKRQLTTTAEDPRQSEEGETLKTVQRICQKFENGGKPHKFPKPGTSTHVLLVDMRTFLNGGDKWDRLNVALGSDHVPHEFFRRYYEGKRITGVFNSKTNLKGAAEARERLHFIGFVDEKAYETGAFGPAIQFFANPNLFKTPEEAHKALAGWPLGVPYILNAPVPPAHLVKLAETMSSLTVSQAADLAKLLKDKWQVGS